MSKQNTIRTNKSPGRSQGGESSVGKGTVKGKNQIQR